MCRNRRRLVRHNKSTKKASSDTFVRWCGRKGLYGDIPVPEANPDILPEDTLASLWGDTSSPEIKAIRSVLEDLDRATNFTLTPKQKIVFRLCVIEGKTEREAAKVLKLSPSAVHQHKQLIYKKIRQAFLVEIEQY